MHALCSPLADCPHPPLSPPTPPFLLSPQPHLSSTTLSQPHPLPLTSIHSTHPPSPHLSSTALSTSPSSPHLYPLYSPPIPTPLFNNPISASPSSPHLYPLYSPPSPHLSSTALSQPHPLPLTSIHSTHPHPHTSLQQPYLSLTLFPSPLSTLLTPIPTPLFNSPISASPSSPHLYLLYSPPSPQPHLSSTAPPTSASPSSPHLYPLYSPPSPHLSSIALSTSPSSPHLYPLYSLPSPQSHLSSIALPQPHPLPLTSIHSTHPHPPATPLFNSLTYLSLTVFPSPLSTLLTSETVVPCVAFSTAIQAVAVRFVT